MVLLIALTVVLTLAYTVVLAVLIRNDGRLTFGHQPQPPRSHCMDMFEPPRAWS